MHKLLGALFLFAAFSNVMLGTVNFQDCGSEYNLDNVDIEGCNRSSCILPKGKSANIHIKLFGRSADSHWLYQTVYLIFNGIHVPLPVVPAELCTKVECPVRGTANASFSALMNFATLPNVQSAVVLYWQIHNEKKDLLMCFKVAAKYENPKRHNRYL